MYSFYNINNIFLNNIIKQEHNKILSKWKTSAQQRSAYHACDRLNYKKVKPVNVYDILRGSK